VEGALTLSADLPHYIFRCNLLISVRDETRRLWTDRLVLSIHSEQRTVKYRLGKASSVFSLQCVMLFFQQFAILL